MKELQDSKHCSFCGGFGFVCDAERSYSCKTCNDGLSEDTYDDLYAPYSAAWAMIDGDGEIMSAKFISSGGLDLEQATAAAWDWLRNIETQPDLIIMLMGYVVVIDCYGNHVRSYSCQLYGKLK